MTREKNTARSRTEEELWWDEVPEEIREGIREEQEMWEYAKKLEAEIMKPRGILGFFGYRIRLP